MSPFLVSLSFSLASFTSLCHSLCLSRSVFFFLLPCCLLFIFTFLVLLLFFIVCFFAFVSWKEQHQNITFEIVFFMNDFCLCFCFLFQICSYICFFFHYLSCVFGAHECFSFFPRRPFLKHQFWFCTLRKVIVFFRAHFGGNVVVQETLQK